MKEIKAYIRKDKLDATTIALAQIENLQGVSISSITGFGRSRGVLSLVNFETHIKLETVCEDEIADTVISTIEKAARIGRRGDGKIFVSNVHQAVRIETGERNKP